MDAGGERGRRADVGGNWREALRGSGGSGRGWRAGTVEKQRH